MAARLQAWNLPFRQSGGGHARQEGNQRKFPWEDCLASLELIHKLAQFCRMFGFLSD